MLAHSGTATSATDYTADTSLTIAAGATSGTKTYLITGDTLDENNETIIVTISSATNATLGSSLTHTITITDDDDAPTVQVSATSSTVAEAKRTACSLIP